VRVIFMVRAGVWVCAHVTFKVRFRVWIRVRGYV